MEAADEELMLAYRHGDAGAFDRLYGRHKGPLYRYVLRTIAHNLLTDDYRIPDKMRARIAPR